MSFRRHSQWRLYNSLCRHTQWPAQPSTGFWISYRWAFRPEAMEFWIYTTFLSSIKTSFNGENWYPLGTHCWFSFHIRSRMLVQRNQGDRIKGKGSHKLEDTSDSLLLCLWDSRRPSGWIAWTRRRLHLGTPFSWIGNPSPGRLHFE